MEKKDLIGLTNLAEKAIPLMPLLGLFIGYICFFVVDLFRGEKEIQFEVPEPEYIEQQIGCIPASHLIGPLIDVQQSNGKEIPIKVSNYPRMDNNGKPILKTKKNSCKIKGSYEVVITDMIEIQIPKLGDPAWKEESIIPSRLEATVARVEYKPNIINVGSGIYYPVKEVRRTGIKLEDFAFYGQTIGVILSFWLLMGAIKPESKGFAL